MKLFLMTITALFSISTFATTCPNLAGTYTCQDQDGFQYINTYTQSVINGYTTYTIVEEGFQVVANNQWQIFSQDGIDGQIKAACSNGALLGEWQGAFEGNTINVKSSTSLSGNMLITKMSTTFNGMNLPDQLADTCTKN